MENEPEPEPAPLPECPACHTPILEGKCAGYPLCDMKPEPKEPSC